MAFPGIMDALLRADEAATDVAALKEAVAVLQAENRTLHLLLFQLLQPERLVDTRDNAAAGSRLAEMLRSPSRDLRAFATAYVKYAAPAQPGAALLTAADVLEAASEAQDDGETTNALVAASLCDQAVQKPAVCDLAGELLDTAGPLRDDAALRVLCASPHLSPAEATCAKIAARFLETPPSDVIEHARLAVLARRYTAALPAAREALFERGLLEFVADNEAQMIAAGTAGPLLLIAQDVFRARSVAGRLSAEDRARLVEAQFWSYDVPDARWCEANGYEAFSVMRAVVESEAQLRALVDEGHAPRIIERLDPWREPCLLIARRLAPSCASEMVAFAARLRRVARAPDQNALSALATEVLVSIAVHGGGI